MTQIIEAKTAIEAPPVNTSFQPRWTQANKVKDNRKPPKDVLAPVVIRSMVLRTIMNIQKNRKLPQLRYQRPPNPMIAAIAAYLPTPVDRSRPSVNSNHCEPNDSHLKNAGRLNIIESRSR